MKHSAPPSNGSLQSASLDPFPGGPPTSEIQSTAARFKESLGRTVQFGLLLGQQLLEKKAALGHGCFMDWRRDCLPDLSDSKAQRLMGEMLRFRNAFPLPAIDVPASVIVLTPDKDLPAPALQYKQAWLNFSDAKHFTDLRERLCALTGKTKGGNPDPAARKEFGKHIENHFEKIGALFTRKKRGAVCGYKNFSMSERAYVVVAMNRSIEFWPRWMLEGQLNKIKRELGLSDAARLHRSNE